MFFEDDDSREPGFFFSVSGVPKDKSKDRYLKFNFNKLSNQSKLLSFGHKPIALEVSHQEYLDLKSGKKGFFK